MSWTTAGLILLVWIPTAIAAWLFVLYFYLCSKYLPNLVRIFEEKPIFIIPRGERPADAADVRFPTRGGLTLCGAYLKTKAPRRRGVILFGLEFGANRWSCVPYCQPLLDAGFDIFTWEPRNQGDSDADPTYQPLQWVTDKDEADCAAAVAYLKSRPDADPRGVGLYGVSKGGGAGLAVAGHDPWIRCCCTDGAFATLPVMVPYMRHWFSIYNQNYLFHGMIRAWYYALVARAGMREAGRRRGVRYVCLERAVRRLAPRPWLMIHGEKDGYIKPSMAKAFYDHAREPKDFWLVASARHNQAIEVAGEEYRRRVVGFFEEFLADPRTGA